MAKSTLLILVSLVGCERIDGTPFDPVTLGSQACTIDAECGRGRFCTAGHFCSVECLTSKDCVFRLADPSGPNDLDCSPCGRCLARGANEPGCASTSERICADTAECRTALGNDYVCSDRKLCARTCKADAECRQVGRGWSCGDDGLCAKRCFRPHDCTLHGWGYQCALPASVDPVANAEAAKPVYATCEPRKDGIDWGPADPAPHTGKGYPGVWAWMVNTAARTIGVPFLGQQDTVSNQYALVKVTQNGKDLTLQQRWCSIDLRNFNADDSHSVDLLTVIVPERYVDSIPILLNHAQGVPAMAPGAKLVTDRMLEVRGARLRDPERSPLPTFKNLDTQWDQDRDGQPGLTMTTTGVLAGEIYHALRWWVIYTVNVVDVNHWQGLIETFSEQKIIGATKPALVYDVSSIAHPQPDRSYFRAKRMPDGATCADVIALKNTVGSWMEFQPHYDDSKRPH